MCLCVLFYGILGVVVLGFVLGCLFFCELIIYWGLGVLILDCLLVIRFCEGEGSVFIVDFYCILGLGLFIFGMGCLVFDILGGILLIGVLVVDWILFEVVVELSMFWKDYWLLYVLLGNGFVF